MKRTTLPAWAPRLLALLVTLSPCHLATLSSAARGADKPEYNRDIRPILAENCFACHGPDSAARKAGLRLDVREQAVKREAIVPGDPEKSALVERIFSQERGQMMPPPKSHKKLTAAQKETLKRWVAAGAEYQPHWSFLAPKRPPLPVVKNAG
jgi:mono/diheme cytochrome c family protein